MKTAFLVENFTKKEKKVVEKFSKKNKINNYEIFSINKENNIDGAKYINVNKKFYKIQDMAFYLLDQREKEVDDTAEMLSKITNLNLKMFTKRLLIIKFFYREAKLLISKEILLEEKEIKKVIILNKYKDMLINRDDVLNYYNNFKDVFIFLMALLRYSKYIAKMIILALKKKNITNYGNVINKKSYDIIAVQYTSLHYQLIKKTLKLLLKKYSIAVTSAFQFHCIEEIVPFKTEKGIDKIKIYPRIRFSDILKLIYFFKLLKIKYYKQCIIGNFREILIRIIQCRHIAKEFNPKVILIPTDGDLFKNVEYAFFNNLGIKYINYMHGDKNYDVELAFIEFHKMAVWGKHYINLYEKKLRAKKGMIEVTGNQLFDEIPKYKIKDKELLILKNKYSRVVSVFTQWANSHDIVKSQYIMIQKVVNFINKSKNIYLIVKHHPLEFQHLNLDCKPLLKKIEDRRIEITNEKRLYDILAVSDLVITPWSTVGLEAILFKKPVLFMNFGDKPRLLEYPKFNAAIEINDPEESEFYLDKMLFDEKYKEKIDYNKVKKNWANNLDGLSHFRLKEIIENIIDK